MNRLLAAVVGMTVGYALFMFAGYRLLWLLSHKQPEHFFDSIYTAVFAIGPAGAVIGLIAGLLIAALRPESLIITVLSLLMVRKYRLRRRAPSATSKKH